MTNCLGTKHFKNHGPKIDFLKNIFNFFKGPRGFFKFFSRSSIFKDFLRTTLYKNILSSTKSNFFL